MKRSLLSILASLLVVFQGYGQSQKDSRWQYIETYKDMAVEQMHRHKIPASITLAQGICESNAGRSRLATEAHNHFGIKVGSGWKGPYIVIADDRPDDRFRVYKSDQESFEDHSLFLCNNKRYRSLFQLKITDYKGWANGLKRCGYATNPNYAPMLIDVIERYNLSQFDTRKTGTGSKEESIFYQQHIVYKVNNCYLIIANGNDTWEEVASETGVSIRKLLRYNERPKNYELQSGDIVYLTKKRKKAAQELAGIPHVVVAGESLYDISQRYAVRLESLYKLNTLSPEYVPQVGDLIWLR